MYINNVFLVLLIQFTIVVSSISFNENAKFLGRRRKPAGCNFNTGKRGVYKTDGTGRTFFDWTSYDVNYNYQYNINCGGNSDGNKPSSGGHKPPFGHRPFRPQKPFDPSFGNKPSADGHEDTGGIFNRPHKPILSMIVANKPLQTIFGKPQDFGAGIIGDIFSGFGSFLPKPQEIGHGLGEGISSFFQTLPQIGESFQSLLPDFGNFQLPNFPQAQGGSVANPAANPTVTPAVTPTFTTQPPPIVTTTDPDDIIYNEEIKPVHEDHDEITDPYITNKLPPGSRNYFYSRKYGSGNNAYRENIGRSRYPDPYQGRSNNYEPASGRFRFPS